MSYIKHRADESQEDYLETILLLQKRLGQVRSIDIATEMNFSKPSVSVAMKTCAKKLISPCPATAISRSPKVDGNAPKTYWNATPSSPTGSSASALAARPRWRMPAGWNMT